MRKSQNRQGTDGVQYVRQTYVEETEGQISIGDITGDQKEEKRAEET